MREKEKSNRYSYDAIKERQEMEDGAQRTLALAKRQEKKRLRIGWRYVQATPSCKIFIPCDRNGNPTTAGQKRLDEFRQNFGYSLK